VNAPDWWTELDDEDEPRPDVSVNVHLGHRPKTLRAADHALGLIRTALPQDIRTDRLRHVAYNASAAYAGWQLGAVSWCLDGITHYGALSTPRGVWVGIGLCLAACVVEWRTHGLRTPGRYWLARIGGWAGRIPLASAALALALYAAPFGVSS
jgi:hypothetical protein